LFWENNLPLFWIPMKHCWRLRMTKKTKFDFCKFFEFCIL
jgi:hypothetical protein